MVCIDDLLLRLRDQEVPFQYFYKGIDYKDVGAVGCALWADGQKVVNDRVTSSVYVKPYSRGPNPPNGNVYSARVHRAYYIRGVNGDLVNKGSFDERFRVTQWSAGAYDRCDLINSVHGSGRTVKCLGFW